MDEEAQVVLSAELTNQAGDVDQLMDMMAATEDNLDEAGIEGRPTTTMADAGHCSEENLKKAADAQRDVLIATGRLRHGERVPASPRGWVPKDATHRERMARRLRTKPGRADYPGRKAIVEPVFGQTKVRQRAGFLRLRGLEGAQGEWMFHALCHNLRMRGRDGRPGRGAGVSPRAPGRSPVSRQ